MCPWGPVLTYTCTMYTVKIIHMYTIDAVYVYFGSIAHMHTGVTCQKVIYIPPFHVDLSRCQSLSKNSILRKGAQKICGICHGIGKNKTSPNQKNSFCHIISRENLKLRHFCSKTFETKFVTTLDSFTNSARLLHIILIHPTCNTCLIENL